MKDLGFPEVLSLFELGTGLGTLCAGLQWSVTHVRAFSALQLHVELTVVRCLQVEFRNGAYSIRLGPDQQS